MKRLTPGQRVDKKAKKIIHICGVLKRKAARIERVKKAFHDYWDGRITRTELRRRVPRSWMDYA